MEITRTTTQGMADMAAAALGAAAAQGTGGARTAALSGANLTITESAAAALAGVTDMAGAAARLERQADEAVRICRQGMADIEDQVLGEGASPATSGEASMLFDIYQMLALLAEVAQKQRDAAREMRLAESVQIQVSIQQQADEQREAAQLGLTMGIISAVVATAMCAVSISMTVRSQLQQSAGMKTQGVAQAQSEFKGAMQAQAKVEQAQAKFDTVSQKVEAAVTKDGGSMADFKARLEGNMPESTAAKATLQEKQLALTDAEGDLSAAKAELAAAKAQLASEPNGGTAETRARVTAAEQRVAAETARVDTCRAEAQAAQDTYLQKLDSDVARLGTQLRNAPAADKADLQRQYDYASAMAQSESVTLRDGGQAKVEAEVARVKLEAAEKHLETDADYISGSRWSTAAQNITQVNQTLTNLLNTVGQTQAEMRQADATAIGAETQKHEQELAEVDDLFKQCQDILDAALEAQKAIQQKESETTQTIIQA